jgi:hypothetical protein
MVVKDSKGFNGYITSTEYNQGFGVLTVFDFEFGYKSFFKLSQVRLEVVGNGLLPSKVLSILSFTLFCKEVTCPAVKVTGGVLSDEISQRVFMLSELSEMVLVSTSVEGVKLCIHFSIIFKEIVIRLREVHLHSKE